VFRIRSAAAEGCCFRSIERSFQSFLGSQGSEHTRFSRSDRRRSKMLNQTRASACVHRACARGLSIQSHRNDHSSIISSTSPRGGESRLPTRGLDQVARRNLRRALPRIPRSPCNSSQRILDSASSLVPHVARGVSTPARLLASDLSSMLERRSENGLVAL